MSEPHACGQFRGVLATVREDHQFPPTRILITDFAEQYVRKNLSHFLEAGSLRPNRRSDVPSCPICIAPWTTSRESPSGALWHSLWTGVKNVPVRSVHLWDAIQITPPRLGIPTICDPAFCCIKTRGLPNPLHTILRPLWNSRLYSVLRGPEHCVPCVIAVQRCHIGRCFQVGMVRTQIPFIRICTWPAV